VSEVRAPSPEAAGFYLDSVLDVMANKGDDPVRHFIFTLHLYQYSVDKNGKTGTIFPNTPNIMPLCHVPTAILKQYTYQRESQVV